MIRLGLIIAIFVSIGCRESSGPENNHDKNTKGKPVRYGMITGVKPEKIEYYKQLHSKPWPQVLSTLKACNIQNYSIYLQKLDEQYILFSYFEYVGNNFETDMKKMAADSITRKWWKETDPCQVPLPEALENHQVWTNMPEVFHTD